MIRRNTWILLVLLAALIGFTVYFNNRKAQEAAKATPTSGPVSLFNSSVGEPNDIKIDDSTGNSVEVARDSTGTWTVKAPKAGAADQASAEAAATQVSSLRVLGDVQLGLDIVGLDKPSYTITLVFKGGTTHTLTVGSTTPIQTGYYVQVDNAQTRIVDKSGIDALLKLLQNPPYAATATPAESPTPTATSTATPEPPTPTSAATSTPATTTATP